MNKSFKDHFKAVEENQGFSKGTLSKNDLTLFRDIIYKNYQKNLKANGLKDQELLSLPISDYHTFSDKIEHGAIWNKLSRILNPKEYKKILTADFFIQLHEELGEVVISDEEDIGYPEIYYRLVRPKPYVDVGPLHADKWFWDLGHGSVPNDVKRKRIKFWFSLWNCNHDTGFRFVEGSHLKDYKYTSEIRDGFAKPVFNEKSVSLDISYLQGEPGSFIIFNDRLLHGGYPTNQSTRVSFEFTLFVKESFKG
tara:strand:- start:626 stop:1381 length:756 start_codon:yes stop_codon:yes gene_type:complete